MTWTSYTESVCVSEQMKILSDRITDALNVLLESKRIKNVIFTFSFTMVTLLELLHSLILYSGC